ncbi:phytanoyl-CoA dioxygenase family protein [Pedobacter sp. SYSU D00535]|uniref:phytanoyl-CoA dioxygenase family protein n=1 Tax=Pedobacter sp. SYSU D00535 TaxID=2810308 RepID=UPI001A961307|nr:phytanoyl-CoA dioxygenase family protein [Pedobacter sp. SYSU D00535]
MENKLNYSEATTENFNRLIYKYGWVVYENVLDAPLLEEINNSLEEAYLVRRHIQVMNGIGANTDGTLHHLIDKDNFALNFLKKMYFDEEMKCFFNGNYVLNSFGGVMVSKGSDQYVQKIHRDVRSFTGDLKMMIQMIVLLDDFTEDNGATYLLNGSHLKDERPDDDYFYQNASRAIAKKGSIILFDSHLWHAAGVNFTDIPRRALTIGFSRPFMKQQLDYPRYLGYEYGEGLDEELRQVLGYNARVPANLYEFYQPPHKRMYMPGQG